MKNTYNDDCIILTPIEKGRERLNFIVEIVDFVWQRNSESTAAHISLFDPTKIPNAEIYYIKIKDKNKASAATLRQIKLN